MIYGIGADLVKVTRIASTLNRFGNQFINRILSTQERKEYDAYTKDKSQFLASRYQCTVSLTPRWAVKEAVYKALGSPGVPFQSIHVLAQHQGIRSPLVLELEGKAKEVAEKSGITVVCWFQC